jgi:urease accessory protein
MYTFNREGGPTIFAQVKNGVKVDHIVNLILSAWKASGAAGASTKSG